MHDIIKLIGTTKATIQKIRERSHWNAANIKAVDPVTLGLMLAAGTGPGRQPRRRQV